MNRDNDLLVYALHVPGTGLGRASAHSERIDNANARDGFDARIAATGRVPGTHTLGEQFRTAPVVAFHGPLLQELAVID